MRASSRFHSRNCLQVNLLRSIRSVCSSAAASLRSTICAQCGKCLHSGVPCLTPPGRSLWLDARELHHFPPFVGFFGDKLTELGGRTSEWFATYFGKLCPH